MLLKCRFLSQSKNTTHNLPEETVVGAGTGTGTGTGTGAGAGTGTGTSGEIYYSTSELILPQ